MFFMISLKKQLSKITGLLIRVGEGPLMDFSPESYIKDYSNTLSIVNMQPKHYETVRSIICEDYMIMDECIGSDVQGNIVTYFTLKLED